MTIYVCLAAALAAAVVIIYDRLQTARTMDRFEQMLDEAASGRFEVLRYNESRMSSIESRMADYLAAAALSA